MNSLRKCFTQPHIFRRYNSSYLDHEKVKKLQKLWVPMDIVATDIDTEYPPLKPNTIQVKSDFLTIPLVEYIFRDYNVTITPFLGNKPRVQVTFPDLQSLSRAMTMLDENRSAIASIKVSLLRADPIFKLTDEEYNNIPYGRFAGDLILVDKLSQTLPAIQRLLEGHLPQDINKPFPLMLGMDAEWKPVAGSRLSLLQLSTEHTAVLFRLKKLGSVPKELRQLLENPHIKKSGVALEDDGTKLAKDWNVTSLGLEDTKVMFPHAGRFKPGGLAGLTAIFCGFRLDKAKAVQMSNWEAPELSERQIQYAALDAWSSRALHLKLSSFKVPKTLYFPFDPKEFPPILSPSLKLLNKLPFQ